MAFFDAPRESFLPTNLFRIPAARIAALFETPFSRRQRRIQRRIAALRGLSDEELRQIGVRREAIAACVLRNTPKL